MKTTTKLRELLNRDQLTVAPFVMNGLLARIAESVGFEAVYMTGSGTSAEKGFPDVGMLTMTEMVMSAKYIVNAVDIPVICDADTGYGNALNVRRTVREYETAGVAGIHIEDQVFPIYMKHTYDGHAGFDEESSTSVHIMDRERVSIGDEYEVHRLILQEADTSA